MITWNPFAFSGLLVGITCLTMGTFIFLTAPRSPLCRRWSAFTLSVAIWGFGTLWIGLESDSRHALWVWRGVVIYAHLLIGRLFRQASGIKRTQCGYILVAFAIAYTTGSLCYLPTFGIDLYPYGNFGILAYPILVSYAIARYNLMQVTAVFHRALASIALLTLILLLAAIPLFIPSFITLDGYYFNRHAMPMFMVSL